MSRTNNKSWPLPALTIAAALIANTAQAQNWRDLAPPNSPGDLIGQWGMTLGTDAMATIPQGPIVMHGVMFQSTPGANEDTFLFDGSRWSRAGAPLPPEMIGRSGGSLAYNPVNGRVVLYANRTYILPNSETFEFDLTANTWTLVEAGNNPGTTSPTAFYQHSVCSTNQGVLLFGGGGIGPSVVDETWLWDGTSWTQLAPAHAPSARQSAFMAYDSARNVAVLFGGRAANLAELNDTWQFDGTDWTQVATDGAPSPRISLDGSIIYDAVRRRCILRSGPTTASPDGETWEFDGARWWRITTAFRPASYSGSTLGYHEPTGTTIAIGATPFIGSDTTYAYGGTGAAMAAFGKGCFGAGGTPELRPVGNSVPALGATFTTEITKAISLYSWMLAGTTSTVPVPLAPIGMPSTCTGYLDSIDVVSGLIGNPATYSIAIPNNAALQGAEFYLQGFVFDPSTGAPLELIASNAGQLRIY